MSHLVPSYYSNWFPFSSFDRDWRRMQRLLDTSDVTTDTSGPVEPSYRYHADDKAAHFEIELPGVSKENCSVEVVGHKLVVKGMRTRKQLTKPKVEQPQEGAKTEEPAAKVKKEEPTITYLLEARLAQGADVDAIKADHCGDGVLTVTVPMKVDQGARKIQITL